MKKEKLNYFDEFVKNVSYALESAEILNEYVNDFNSDIVCEKEEVVHKLENDADHNLHNILNYLIKDFVPPFEREDIIMLVHSIDDLEDNIDEVVINLNILGVMNLRDDAKDFTILIKNSTAKLKELFLKFKDIKKYEIIHKYVIEINEAEDMGDKIYQKSMKNLFTNESNPIEIIKWRKIYDCLENCMDSCEKIANNVEEIILKLN